MQYDDTARRYNFLAGLGVGAALGVALAMLAMPQKKVLTRRIERARRGLERRPLRRRAEGKWGTRRHVRGRGGR